MCVVSMIGDHYRDHWHEPYDTKWRYVPTPVPDDKELKDELEALRKEVENMKELLKKAVQYDRDNGEPDCQMDEKIALLKRSRNLSASI